MATSKSNVEIYHQVVYLLRLIEGNLPDYLPFDTEKEIRDKLPQWLRERHRKLCLTLSDLYKIADTWSDPQLSKTVFY